MENQSFLNTPLIHTPHLKTDVESRLQCTDTTGTGFIRSCYIAISAFLGIGILTLPYAVARSGWLALILLAITAYMSFCTAILLKRCMQADPYIRSYQDIAELAFGKEFRLIVHVLMNMELYLVAVGLLIIEGDTLHKLFPNFVINLGGLRLGGELFSVVVTALVILPSALLTDLGVLSYVFAMGAAAIIIIVVSILFTGVSGGVGFDGKSQLLIMGGFPTSIALFIACFGGHPVVPTVYISMKNKHQFTMVMLISFLFNNVIYISIAVVGYLMYGSDVQSQITLNLPTRELSSKLAIYTTLAIPVCRYALVMTPVASSIETGLMNKNGDKRSIRLLTRIALLISVAVTACIFPYFESLMAVVGSICVVLASFLLPCCCYLKISGTYRKWSFELVGIIWIIIFGTVAGVVGTYASISDLVGKM
ncbi:hypothetical protein VitviT2T_014001 [Vitis vinifera]|uniref:Amino acid transporter transmembrane domain-containing protein n=2 Tax=Vitis vinifera TaxID=29760 RepID=A0ABY9CKL6_VITVI|nr:amino acid transporter AVT1I [Vitis vinifera]WJZ95215.1 hypothetical protein VitviT2T_014001 [Vitis vinifera]|eukprot:XP_010655008.1 PREDICTED: vacuolar amino acid transporter 1 [Vitis vinifera]